MEKTVGNYQQKTFKNYRKPGLEIPNLVQHQLDAYERFINETIEKVFKEQNPISDYSEKKFDLIFKKVKFDEVELDEFSARKLKISLERGVKGVFELVNKNTGTKKEQEIFLFDMPVMTNHGTFVINGVEKNVIPQLIKSSGVFFTVDETKKERFFGAKIMPKRGVWLEIDFEPKKIISVKIDKKRKLPVTSLLRAFGKGMSDEEILDLFNEETREVIKRTFENDPATSIDESYIEIYNRMRDSDKIPADLAKEYVDGLFEKERYDISELGRIRFNERFNKGEIKKYTEKEQVLTLDDLVTILEHIVYLNNNKDEAEADDIDHLGYRRLKFFDEQLEDRLRIGVLQMARNIRDKMSIADSDVTNPSEFINTKPIQARIKEFFNTNPLAQFIDQDNILYELESNRTVSALGQGGLVRERAKIEVRDVHNSHYGRLCPIHTPEGQNIGLILRLAVHSRVNRFGLIETPYYVVKNGEITDEIVYLDAFQEEKAKIAHFATKLKGKKINQKEVEVRYYGEPIVVDKKEVEYMDISPYQMFSVATSMIPFVNHDEANRALMGSNMQKQAVPCVKPEAPLVATGIEKEAAKYTGRLLYAKEDGEITYVSGSRIEMKTKSRKKKVYNLVNYEKTNTFVVFHQRPVVKEGQKVKAGDLLADTTSSDNGQLAVGQNILVAFISFYGANYEDAIIVSERIAKNHKFTNVHVKEYVIDVRETKLGPEETTRDIPGVSEEKVAMLDENGIIQIGAEVEKGDILVGKVTPKNETQLTPEEKLLRSIFGEKARDVKDSSVRLKAGEKGRVVGVQVFDRKKGEINENGIIKRIYVQVAELRNIKVGDKLSGRHGNKGVVSMILPEEDMPYTEDGRPIDIILSPLGVPSRMNIGQILEVHLGLAANTLQYQAIVPPFSGATEEEIEEELKKAGFKETGKMPLIDGYTGEKFDKDILVGYMYILKLHHMVEDKMHVRSVGPYSLINQQPLGGKANEGGQRFGEMEVWALLAHGVAYSLREVLTVKSDDIIGRSALYDAIIKGKKFILPNTPESFNVMVSTLRGLALNIVMGKDNQ